MKKQFLFIVFALLGTLGVANGQKIYDFRDGTIITNGGSEDGTLTLSGGSYKLHGATYGLNMKVGGKISISVDGSSTIRFLGSVHSSLNLVGVTSGGDVFGTQYTKVATDLSDTFDFVYIGAATTLEFTTETKDGGGSDLYLPLITVIKNDIEIIPTDKIDVWDFGAAQLDESLYTNWLTADVINAWYPGVEPGTTNKPLPGGFTVGVLSWVGGTNSDRLRTSNMSLTRYDSNSSPVTFEGEEFTGNLYVNASATSARYIGLTLSEDDEVTIYAKTQNGAGKLTFEYMGDNTQKDVADVANSIGVTRFVAKKKGSYHIYDSADKPFYYRIMRKDATYVTISGALNLEEAGGIPEEYSLILTNEAGKEFAQTLTSTSANYSITVPSGYAYTLSLGDANGYIITNGISFTIEENTNHDVAIKKVVTNRLSGSITGLSTAQLEDLELVFTPENEDLIFVPVPVINTTDATYTVDIELNNNYTISVNGLNDYYVTNNVVNITADSNFDIVLSGKQTYKVNIAASGLSAEQISKLNIIFTNLNESGYSYTFTDMNNIYLRDGIYSITCSGLDEYPLVLGATSNLTVNGAEAAKDLVFKAVTNWPFNDTVITNGVTTVYKGMLFTGAAYNEISKGHLVIKDNATVQIPMNPGEKMVITYYYSAKFSVVEGEIVETASNSTSLYESVEYAYSGSDPGYMTITNISGTTYITDVTVAKVVPYSSAITVGTDKEYQTINDALDAIRAMNRPNSERVEIMVDPGNYEEMLVVNLENISIINASATPSIALLNSGVDIDEHAVRITSYYGHGYDYFSMGTDQKWSADALRVNKENGYNTYSNAGSGTTNGSYWNATVVVSAKGFEASHIIFENSFNQYISKKESEDVVVEWASGGKGPRPVEYGNTEVQNKSFVERAAAIAYTAGGDRSILNNCRVVGRQDSFFGAEGARVVAFKGSLMGGTDYLFGGMTLVAYQSDLAMNTSETSTDVAYITAAQQSSARGYLLYECTITSAQPGTETASAYLSKPGYFGRPWQANTSEAVFYNTIIKATDNPSYSGKSMINPVGWLSSLGGESNKSYEYGTIEESGENHSAERASWSRVLSTPTLSDGTEITTLNFTKGNDGWDPIPTLIATSVEEIANDGKSGDLNVVQFGNMIKISGIDSTTNVSVYEMNGVLTNSFKVNTDTEFALNQGFWIVKVLNSKDQIVSKVLIP